MTQNRKETRARPGWRGPGLTKSTKTSQTPKCPDSKASATSAGPVATSITVELQQLLLNIFKNVFPSLTEGGPEALKPLLQEVKQALFDRDFERAFGRQDYLEAYAFRWSPSRALCYVSLLVDLQEHLAGTSVFRGVLECKSPSAGDTSGGDAGPSSSDSTTHVACLGGGAAEVVAFGGLLSYLLQNSKPSHQKLEGFSVTEAIGTLSVEDTSPARKLDLLLIDTAAWGPVIHDLSKTLTSPPPLSKYASPSAKAANAPLLPRATFTTAFQQNNLLEINKKQLEELLGQHPMIITLLFTLNELYSSSITKTTAFLLNLTVVVPRETVLLVVDSPGSYSEAMVGKEAKKYPMQWLMDHTLLGKHQVRGEEESPIWEKVVSDDSRWFRLLDDLKYPISLENMRYQLHLFRRL